MAMILKATKSYSDNYGNTYTDAYAVVDQVNGNKKRGEQMVVLEIYKDSQARTDGHMPIASHSYTATGAKWDDDFSPAAVAIHGDHYKAAYKYVDKLKVLDAEGNETETKLWADWKSDEV